MSCMKLFSIVLNGLSMGRSTMTVTLWQRHVQVGGNIDGRGPVECSIIRGMMGAFTWATGYTRPSITTTRRAYSIRIGVRRRI